MPVVGPPHARQFLAKIRFMLCLSSFLPSGFILLAASPLALAQTPALLIVDDTPSPGAQFDSIDAAIDVASAGDVILVREGTYAGFTLDVPATVVADTGVPVLLEGTTEVRGIPAGSVASVIGFTFQDPQGLLQIESNAGLVRLERLDLTYFEVDSGGSAQGPRISITDGTVDLRSVEVGATDPAVEAVLSQTPSGILAPPPAVSVSGSTISVRDCNWIGLPGRDGLDDPLFFLPIVGTPGATALQVSSSSVRLESSQLQGGAGGAGWLGVAQGCVAPRDGGDGLFAAGGSTFLLQLDSSLQGGAPGMSAQGLGAIVCPATASAGSPVQQDPTAFLSASQSNIIHPNLEFSNVLREGQAINAEFSASLGQVILWGVGFEPSSPTPLPGFGFDLLSVGLAGPLFVAAQVPSTIGPDEVVLPPIMNVLQPGTALRFYSQAFSISPSASLALSGPVVETVLVPSGT